MKAEIKGWGQRWVIINQDPRVKVMGSQRWVIKKPGFLCQGDGYIMESKMGYQQPGSMLGIMRSKMGYQQPGSMCQGDGYPEDVGYQQPWSSGQKVISCN